MKSRLEAQSPAERLEKSGKIAERLFALEPFRAARCVSFFVSMPSEVDTHAMIDRALGEGKKILVPRTDLSKKQIFFHAIQNRRELKSGVMGILEPSADAQRAAPGEPACVVVPGLAFDRQGHRVGYGGGFYDRFLASLEHKVVKIGLAFSFQVLEKLPAEGHDEKLDYILTESSI